jgi:hypothetical protein
MAFAIRDLSVLSYAQGYTVWLARTSDPLWEITQPGWASAAVNMLKHCDTIHIQTPEGSGIRSVRSVEGVVTLVPML